MFRGRLSLIASRRYRTGIHNAAIFERDIEVGAHKYTCTQWKITNAKLVLRDLGYLIEREESWLLHPGSGFAPLPRLVQLRPLEKGGVQTTTTLQTHHPALVPDGVFEYQHATGDKVEDSLRKGFEQWAQTGFAALLDALQPMPANCTTLRMTFPEQDGKLAYARRAVLGPVTHWVEYARKRGKC
jgi:hypothetical protein